MKLFWLLAGACTIVHAAYDSPSPTSEHFAQTVEPLHIQDGLPATQDPMQMGAMLPQAAAQLPRHRHEKAHLMKRMSRKNGKWGSSHPRYRLLEALTAYAKYRDTNMAELERWKGLYKNVGKQQKKASTITAHAYIL